MPYCCNCGCEIPATDKTKLCDNCKRIILPFIKFMDASTSSSVRRLISNEKNLRHVGVTDSGMEYLMRVCELHDRKKIREREEREAARANAASQDQDQPSPDPQPETEEQPQDDKYTNFELPLDEPLDLHRKPYGKALLIVMCAQILLGAGAIIYEIILGSLNVPTTICAAALLISSYTSFVCHRLTHDLTEIKKRFR